MSESIHARLDEDTIRVRDLLRRSRGWTDSEIVRRGIQAIAHLAAPNRRRKFAGEGEFDTGIPDMGSNPKYLEGFGK